MQHSVFSYFFGTMYVLYISLCILTISIPNVVMGLNPDNFYQDINKNIIEDIENIINHYITPFGEGVSPQCEADGKMYLEALNRIGMKT